MKCCVGWLTLLPLIVPNLSRAEEPLTREQMVAMLQSFDDRLRNTSDYKALAYIERKERDKSDIIQEALIFRRDVDDKLMITFTAPKSEQGKGYLRVDKNLWFYDPNVGKWERRTERERIGGTDSRRADFDQSKLAIEFDPIYLGREKLGQFDVHHLKLTVKADIDVAFPVIELWVDLANGNVLKRQEFALSGRLMRTAYYPKWQKLFSEAKKKDVWYPKEMRFYDEIDKANSTMVIIKEIDLRALPANMFTKAWLESKSR